LSTATYPLTAGTTILNEVVFASGIPSLPSPSNYYISGTPIYGTVTVTSDPPIDVTVTLSTPAIVGQPITATLTYGGTGATSSSTFIYKWYADNVLIATTSTPTYTPTSAANGKIIEVVVTALNYTGQAVYSSTTNVGKNPNNSTPADPTVIAAQTTPTSITLTPLNNYEYSKDGGSTWQTSNVFTGLTQNTSYTFIQRIAETATMGPSANSNSLSVTTPDQNQYDCDLIKAWIEQLTIPAANYVSANTTAAVASFIQTHIRSLTLPTNTSGIVGTDITVNAGTSGTFTAAPQNNGNGSWANVKVDVAKGSKTATATIPSVTITYTPYTLTVVAATGGSATVTPSQTSYAFGTSITVVATPAHGQKFKQWDYTPSAPTGATSVTGTQTWGKTETLTFNMPSTNLTITARFEPDAAWVAADNQAAAASAATTATYSTPQQLGSGVTATSYHAIIQQMVNAKITSYGASAPAAGYTWLTYLAPVSGTESNPAGVNGYLDFTATITVSGVSTVTNVLRCEIVAAAYKPAQAPTIYRQPQYNTVVYASTSQLELSVKADLPADGGALSYVWYRNSVESNVGGTPLASSNSPTYKVSINEPGTWYYYVVITNTKNGNAGTNPSVATTAQIRSNTATVVVRPIVSPTNYMRPVNIKEANVKDFVTVSPRFGVHWISSRSDFSFTVHANDGYDLSGLTVKTDVPIEYTIEKSPAETDGSIATATVTLLFVNLEVNVTLDGVAAVGGSAGGIGGGETTGNAAIANSSLRVWSLDRDLYISGLQQGKAFNVYNIAGKLIYSGISSVGKTEHVRIPAAGIYLLKTDDKTVKAVVK